MTIRAVAAGVLAAAAVVLSGAPAVRAAEPPRPLRTLVYDVLVSIGSLQHVRRPLPFAPVGAPRRRNIPTAPRSGLPAPTGADGSIRVDVIAATGDGGLVVDMRENASGRSGITVRFAITRDGSVGYDPKLAENVSGEELALARWLSRGFYAEHPTEAGAAWTIDQSGDGVTGTERYRVAGSTEHRVTLDYAMEEKIAGAEAYGETREGSLVYDTSLVVPVRVAYESQTHRNVYGTDDATRASITLTLRSDSFGKQS